MLPTASLHESDPRAAEVQSLLTRARVAVLRRDPATLEEVLSPNYLCVYPDGRILNKAERIRSALTAPASPASIALLENREAILRFCGDVCIVTEVIRQSSRRLSPSVDEWVATSVVHRSMGRWQIVSSQLTPVIPTTQTPPENEKGRGAEAPRPVSQSEVR